MYVIAKLPRVYPILDSQALARREFPLETAAAAFLEGGAGILQDAPQGAIGAVKLFAFRQTKSPLLCREAGAQFVVNDRADFALLLDAALHIGQDDIAPRDARKLMGSEPMIGFSTHNAAQLCAAGGEPVDYVALGPIFVTASKLNPDPAVGVEELRRCRCFIEKPLVAIGGITLENAPDVWRAGADAVAVIAGLLSETVSARGLREADGASGEG